MWKSLPHRAHGKEMFIILNLDALVKLNQEKTIGKPHTDTQINLANKPYLDFKVTSQ